MAINVLDVLTRVKFVGQDFDTYAQEVTDFLQTNYPDDYADYVNNNLGVALIQIIAYSSQNLAFYINQRSTNNFLTVSTSSVAISRLSRMLNYDILPAISARVEVTVEIDQAYVFPIIISKGFRFNAEKGLTYEYRQDTPIIFAPGETQKTFEVREGVTTQNVFISNGIENQIFKLAGVDTGLFIDNESFDLTVGTETWNEQRRITFDATNIFEVNYFSDPPELKFGDGVAGLIPPANQQITANFVITKGLQGNVGTNGILSAQDQLISNNTVIPLTIVSSTESVGGDNPEDLRSVKSKAPEFFQSQNRAITKRDYDAIVNIYPGVAKGDAQIIRSIEQDVTLNDYLDSIVDSVSGVSGTVPVEVGTIVTNLRTYLGQIISDTCRSNTVQVSILSKNINNFYVSPTAQLREDLRLELEEINDAVHVVTVVDGFPNVVSADIEIELLLSPNAVESETVERARLSLEKNDEQPFGLLILREYGVNLYLSDLYKTIEASQIFEGEIEYMNIRITGPVSKLDADGNLIINARLQEVIQPGNVNITIIPRTVVLGS